MSAPAATTTPGKLANHVPSSGIGCGRFACQVARQPGSRDCLLLGCGEVAHGDRARLLLGGAEDQAPPRPLVSSPAQLLAELARSAQVDAGPQAGGPGLR